MASSTGKGYSIPSGTGPEAAPSSSQSLPYDPELYARRARLLATNPGDSNFKRRLFQLSDCIYSQAYSEMKIANHKLTLLCAEAGNFGDISQLLLCADTIKHHRPHCEIDILIKLQTLSNEAIKAVFPTDRFPMNFLSDDYHMKEKEIENVVQTHSVLGIATVIGGPHLSNKHHRLLREYGFGVGNSSLYWQAKDNELSMGLGEGEEGISIPAITSRSFSDISTEWLRTALKIPSHESKTSETGKGKLYSMHLRDWTAQISALATVAKIENGQPEPINIVLPLAHSLEELREWGVLNPLIAHLTKQGIGKITRITPAGPESVTISSSPKEMRILSGPIPKKDMEIIQQHSEPLLGCTGDMSFSEAIALDKVPFYEIPGHKEAFFKSIQKIAEDLKLTHLISFLSLLAKRSDEQEAIYKRNTPRRRGGWWEGSSPFENPYDLKKSDSISRRSVPELMPILLNIADEIGDVYLQPQLMAEALIFSRHIKENYNLTTRLLENVDRAIILKNYPELIEVEENLWKKFNAGEKNLQEVCEDLQKSIKEMIKKPSIDTPPTSVTIKRI